MEEQNGDHERSDSEEEDLVQGYDVLQVHEIVLIHYLVSMRCWGIRPFQKNGKGNEDEGHHVPAPSLIFHLERKPISCPGTPLDVR